MATATTSSQVAPDQVIRRRVGLVAVVLAVTTLIATPAGLLWPEPAAGGETYAYTDIQPLRDRWWLLLMVLSANLVLNVIAQAIATMVIVRRRGSGWATAGGAMMWIGTALYSVGVAGWAATFYFATAPGVDVAAGTAVMAQTADDSLHLFGPMIAGALLVAIGTLIQVVGLWRSHAVPRWIPLLSATIVLTFVVPGNGLAGMLTAVPMAAGAFGIAYCAWRRTGLAVR